MQSQPYTSPTPTASQASQASQALWLVTIAASTIYFFANMNTAVEDGGSTAEQMGRIVGTMVATIVLPLIFVGIASVWKNNRTQKRRVAVFLVATLTFLALPMALAFTMKTVNGSAASGPPWEYRSEEHGVSLVLPNAGWKKSTTSADFWFAGSTQMIAGLKSVEKQEFDQFELSASNLKRTLERRPNRITPPKIQEGVTASGHPYVFATWYENASPGNKRLFVATSSVWLASKESTVTVMFEGDSKMGSKRGRSVEDAEFEAAARDICLSVK